MKKKKNSYNKQKLVIGAGAGIVTAAALGIAAAYLLSGKEGARRRAKMKTWAIKAQKQVAQKVETARKMGETEYKNLVDQAVKHYGSLERIDTQEIMKVAEDLKGDWQKLQKHARAMAKIVKKKKQPTKKTTKRTSAK